MTVASMPFARQFPSNPKAEALSKSMARQSLLHYTTYTYADYLAEEFHFHLAQKLEDVVKGKIKRLIVAAPPQHGKSELVSVRLPTYWLAKRPKDPVIICSYGAILAQSKASEAKAIIESPLYQSLFPNLFDARELKDLRPADKIKHYKKKITSAGVGGPITGFPAALGIIDDPVKNWEQAESFGYRERAWKWYQSTFRTRVWKDGAIVIIMTRWNEDDLVGRILKSQPEKWEIIRYPAVSETQQERDKQAEFLGTKREIGKPDPLNRDPGLPLCPIRFPLDSLQDLKIDINNMAWNAEYQGVPVSPEGNMFRREWFPLIGFDDLPTRIKLVRYWDKAATQDGGTLTCGLLMGKDKLYTYIIDVVKGQWSSAKRESIMRKTAESDREKFGHVTIVCEVEPGSGGLDSFVLVTAPNLAGFSVKKDRPSGAKIVRMHPIQAQAEIGHVMLIRAPWNWDWLNEICAIPNNAYWDQADSTSGAFKFLTRTGWSQGAEE